jgi:hypothetical protein
MFCVKAGKRPLADLFGKKEGSVTGGEASTECDAPEQSGPEQQAHDGDVDPRNTLAYNTPARKGAGND